ncbi:calcium-binding protein [Microcoleus vaginatus PCC 9802]|uniref:PD40 domain-containing protein n=1 Tax=Microcoleus vaginatus TaxID=119532 RepID=UPI00020D1D75|nr:Hemolysin-type calcium-binding region [Microcoleus vaginatus FGP-2]UNU21558.1 calcium-binding protein [Microcoleus vaginatus PCC 9802]
MTITPVSVDSAGNLGNRGSYNPSISADGRFVAFSSLASNIVPGDTNNSFDIFVRDTLTNTTTRVSVDSAGNQADRNSGSPSISADGRFVAFNSDASNIVAGDTNNTYDIFVRDTLTNTTTRLSVDSAGNPGNSNSTTPSISADGRFVAFSSLASNIVPGDTNSSYDIFVRDTLTNTTTRLCFDSANNQGNSGSGSPSISADGRFVAFSSFASNIVPGDTNSESHIFVRDTLTNTTTRVSLDSAGNQADRFYYNPSISADGRFVAFSSLASNIVPGDTNNSFDIFVRDTLTNTTTGVSVDSAGNPGNLQSGSPSISADGRFVAFSSNASNIVPGDTNNSRDIFVRDTLTNITTRVSVGLAGNQGNILSSSPSISADGRFVAFSSNASNIVPGDTNNTDDIFVVDTSRTPNVINGTDGNDNLTGTSGNDIINGLEGDDVLTGLRASDLLNGGDGNDILYGGKGSDTLNGGLGNDNLVGGAGNDVFVLGAGLGFDTISDFANSQDTIQLINGLTFGQLSISPGTNGTLIRVASSGEVLASLTGVAPNLLGSENFISL